MAVDIDVLVYEAVFGEDRAKSRYAIWQAAIEAGVVPASIHGLYLARGANKLPHTFSVPAMNIRGMAYDTARAAFMAAKKHRVGAMIFELARSEMGYTDQPPAEYATTIMAAAVKEGWQGPLFIQCDHFQTKPASPGVPKEGEIAALKALIDEAVAAGFYNVDIDTSTLVDLSRPEVSDQQVPNFTYSAELARYVREHEPEDMIISLGGEIGHIGGKNSTVEDFEAYMDGFNAAFGTDVPGMSKVSVATGSSHGGVVLPDGSLADVAIDFSILKDVSKVAREQYGMGGAVQHGASTLPDEHFSMFAQSEAIEVHLATGFQNMVMDHPAFPKEILDEMYAWVDETKQDERSEDMTDDQFHYSLRKKAWGAFKQVCWDIDADTRHTLRESLADRFAFLYQALNVTDTADLVSEHVQAPVIDKRVENFVVTNQEDAASLEGLDD